MEYFSLREVAAMLGDTPQSISYHVKTGNLKAEKRPTKTTGRKMVWMVSSDELARFRKEYGR
jgi:hypothetical protein